MSRHRFERLRAALDRRQPDLTVLAENVHKPHNFAAVLRTCDAVGVFEVHGVYPAGALPTRATAAGGIGRWVRIRRHADLAAALDALRGLDLRLVAAHPAAEARDFREVDYTVPTAILLGQEKDGLTPEALAAADELVAIPMLGLGASLNVSVAAALILFEAERQRRHAGLYDRRRLDRERYERTLFEWAHPRLAALCRRRGLDYPPLDASGEPLEPVPR